MATATSKVAKMQPETEIAVLQIQVKTLEEKIGELKVDLKSLHDVIESNADETRRMLKSMREQDVKEHSELASKISVLEKWRWMMMGAGIIIGSLGFPTLSAILK
jgi:predicted RNase H-like nuclease (RuvC/YqgF family)